MGQVQMKKQMKIYPLYGVGIMIVCIFTYFIIRIVSLNNTIIMYDVDSALLCLSTTYSMSDTVVSEDVMRDIIVYTQGSLDKLDSAIVANEDYFKGRLMDPHVQKVILYALDIISTNFVMSAIANNGKIVSRKFQHLQIRKLLDEQMGMRGSHRCQKYNESVP